MELGMEVEEVFSAAHSLDIVDSKCKYMHGHNWYVKVTINTVKKWDWIMDFNEIKAIIRALDHKYIVGEKQVEWLQPTNTFELRMVKVKAGNMVYYVPIETIYMVEGRDATAENIARHILEKVKKKIVELHKDDISEKVTGIVVEVKEGEGNTVKIGGVV